jgi:eukaryotic-like serine/threonine-protein kinase
MIGNSFGQYRILEKIGEGGMGEVFLADDTSLQRRVALKFLPTTLAGDPEFRDRFLVEARAAAALSHPNICVIHEVGETEGRPFIAMEYVEGETLQRKIRAGGLGNQEILSIMTQVASGLEEAHGKGIIHRDIKSSNIMITAKGQAKIMDFGLAKVSGGPALTKTHSTLGTVAYMSPEQAEGEEVDHRTDLWSAGVVLYEMLTGELPFPGDRETAVLYHIINDPPKPFKELKPPIPAELRRVATKALKKNPQARYGSAGEMLGDLLRYEEALAAEAAGVLNVRSLLRRLRQPRVAVAVAAGLVAVAAFSAWYAQRRADILWAREVALPEIHRMIQENDVWRNLVAPCRLAEEAEAILGDDPELAALFHECAREIDVLTDPPGATVSYKEYATPDSAWEILGVTPLERIRVPIGIFRWKLEKAGYETVEAAASTWNVGGEDDLIAGYHLVRTLDQVGSAPAGMVRVPATETAIGPLPDFFIGRFEVTNREYKAFVDAGAYTNPDLWRHPFVREGRELSWREAMRAFVDGTGRPGPSTWMGGDFPAGQGDHPVSGMSWYEAVAYAEWAGMSLPTSEHWNVARGAYTPVIQWPQLGGFGIFAPFTNFGGHGSVPAGSLPGITAFGAYDMPGNVREWCWNEAPMGRVVRGGSWEDNTYEFNMERQSPPMDRSPRNGFRLAHLPDREAVPDVAYAFREPDFTPDFRSVEPVSDELFRVYKEQFAYDPSPLNARVERSWQSPGGWTHEVVSFDAAYGAERVLGHLFLPANAPPPYQTVLYFPGDASAWMPSSEGLEDYYEFTMFLSFLVRNGRAVFYPVYKSTFERGGPEYIAVLQTWEGMETHAFAELSTQIVKDLKRSLDYLQTRPDIDDQRIAYYGMSWGAWMGSVINAVEDRFRASIRVGGGLLDVGRPEIRDIHYVHRVTTPTLILNGRYDGYYPPETSSRPLLELLGTPEEDKKLILYETDHIPPRAEYVKETLAWLDKYLGPVGR